MSLTDRQVSENVVVLMHRLAMEKRDLADVLNTSAQSAGQRINGRVSWRPAEIARLADFFTVSTDELMTGPVPPFKEWLERREGFRVERGVVTHGRGFLVKPEPPSGEVGPRYFVMPEGTNDGTPPLSSLSPASMDIMSLLARRAGQGAATLPSECRGEAAGCACMAEDLITTFAAGRFSPVRFDVDHEIPPAHVDALLEAARRTPSAGNSQPWAFIVGRRGDAVHERLTRHLARSSGVWAPSASLLVANLSQRRVEDTDLEYSEFAHYDLGQAVAHLTFQAHHLGLAVHQFRAFDRDALAGEFAVPAHWEVTTMAAVGRLLGDTGSHTGAGTSRERRTRDGITGARVGPERST